MSELTCRAELRLDHLADYLPPIVDRLASFEAAVEQRADGIAFRYPFGSAFLGTAAGGLAMELHSADADSLQRLRELVTVAVQVHAKRENPQVVWKGDLAGDSLVTFRR